MSPSRMPTRTRPSSAASVRRSSVVLPAPGADIRLTVRTPWARSSVRVGRRDAVVLVEDPLEHLDPARARLDVAAVVADVAVMVVVPVVVVLVLGAVGMAVEAAHQRASPRNAGSIGCLQRDQHQLVTGTQRDVRAIRTWRTRRPGRRVS